jgi:hypothetical protein
MDKNTQNALIVWASTAAGGVGGWWAAARLGASYGLRLGPWGAVAGAVAAAVLSKKMLGEPIGLPSSTPDAG